MGGEERIPARRISWEPFLKGGADSGEIGESAGHRHHRSVKAFVHGIEVDHVEPAEYRAVEQHGPYPVERTGRPDEGDHPTARVPSIDSNLADPDRFDVVRNRHNDGGDRRRPVAPRERAVVDRDHSRVGLAERPTQG